MAGLDTRGVADGFMRGFAFVDNYMDKEDAKQRQAKLDQERQEDRQYTRERNEMLDQERRENTEFTQNIQTQQNNRASAAERRKEQEHAAELRKEKAQEIWASFASRQELSEDQRKWLNENPDLNPYRFMDPRVRESVEYFRSAVESGQIKTDDDIVAFANKPKTLESLNQLYRRQINKGEGGEKRIARVYPAPETGKMVFELEIKKPDGTVDRKPMTELRGTDDETIKQVSVGDLSEQLAGMSQLTQFIDNMSDENRKRAIEYGYRVGYLKELDQGEKAKDRYVVVGGQLWDAKAGKYIPRPDSDSETKKLAEKIATSQFEAQGEFEKDKKPYDFFYKGALEMLGSSQPTAAQQSGLQSPDDTGGAPENLPKGLSGSGSKDSPYVPTTQAHIDWFRENAPKGAILEHNGQLFTKK